MVCTTGLIHQMVDEDMGIKEAIIHFSRQWGPMGPFREMKVSKLPSVDEIKAAIGVEKAQANVDKAQASLEKAQAMTPEERLAHARSQMRENIKPVGTNEYDTYISKCEAVVHTLQAWNCAEDYEAFKEYILDHINKELEYMRRARSGQDRRLHKDSDPEDIFEEYLTTLESNVKYSQQQLDTAVRNLEISLKWITGLGKELEKF